MPGGVTPAGTLAASFDAQAAANPHRPLILAGPGPSLTYGQAADASARLANELAGRGARPGDRIAARVGKRVETLLLYLACVRSGAVFVPVNPAYSSEELARIDADPVLTLDDRMLDELVAASAHREPVIDHTPGADDLAVLLYTSGTTGRPKGAMLSQGNIASNVDTLVAVWGLSAHDVLLHALPVFHAHGLFVALGTAIGAGMPMVWLPGFDAGEVIAALGRCTVMMGVPTFYTRLLAEPSFGRDACATVRLFVSGSAPLLVSTHREFEERTGQVILERYGMTETVMITSNPLRGERRPGSVGPPLPGVDVRIAGDGEVQVRGPHVMGGYWRRERGDEWVPDPDGDWFRTGDLGRIDDDGYVWLTGRAKDLIITGGLNVSPLEVELVLDHLPGVVESAVIGLPDPDFGESVVAVVVAAPGVRLDPADVRAAARAHLAGYKTPKRVIVVDALPRNAMGKVEKAALRAQYGRSM